MPLFLPSTNKSLKEFVYTEIKTDSILNDAAASFFSNHIEKLGPERCLYVGQREFACVQFTDTKIDIIGGFF